MHIVTARRLESATREVVRELKALGLFDDAMAGIEVRLGRVGGAYGYHYHGPDGGIVVPAVSLSRLSHLFKGGYTSLRDVLRHEYAHGLADTHRGMIRSGRFRQAFGAPHTRDAKAAYDPDLHVTKYAASAPAEDFAEVFMPYAKHRGALPTRHGTADIRRKWRFVDRLARAVSKGLRTW